MPRIRNRPVRFWVQQGMYSPRDKAVGWRMWTEHGNLPEAEREAKRHEYGRVLEVKEVWHSPNIKPMDDMGALGEQSKPIPAEPKGAGA